jgi:ABC-type phosphate transport system substrate-binding protein
VASDANGFANPAITNITSGTLAEILDGTYSETQDILGASDATNQSIAVIEREPLSGTYNTLEYNVPNTVENKTSQDVGLNQQSAQQNCAGSFTNPMDIVTTDGVGTRTRAIGTGEALNALFGGITAAPPNTAVLGYGFWSVGNFKGAYSGANNNLKFHAKYLTVDGIDPLIPASAYSTVSGNPVYTLPVGTTGAAQCAGTTTIAGSTVSYCPAGTIPTATNLGVNAVTLQNVKNGSYPAWSFLRLVCNGSLTGNGCTSAQSLISSAQAFITFNLTSGSNPDFVPVASSTVVRSHFLPPGIGAPCSPVSNGVNFSGTLTGFPVAESEECGGDVGGVVFTQLGDDDYAADIQSVPTGFNGNRR